MGLYPRGLKTRTKKHFETSCSSVYRNVFRLLVFNEDLKCHNKFISSKAIGGLISGGWGVIIGCIFWFRGRWAYNQGGL